LARNSPREQPPNHYRLLGVEPFESNPNVIQDAATERMNYLQVFTQGRQADLGRRLCQETVAAKECLLSPRRKAVYDSQLRMDLSQEAGRPHSSLPPPLPSGQGDLMPGELPPSSRRTSPRVIALAVTVLMAIGLSLWTISVRGCVAQKR
jgi:hypothetical protein